MSMIELLLIGIGLSMDAFAVSICKGLSAKRISCRHYMSVGIYFGGFQALMPFLGYLAGYGFQNVISSFDYIIAFSLLAVIGINMIKESCDASNDGASASFSLKTMSLLAVATSIDALAVGVTFAALGCGFRGHLTECIYFNAAAIGAITFIISIAGMKIGAAFGMRFKQKAEIIGGAILILIGFKIFAEHFLG